LLNLWTIAGCTACLMAEETFQRRLLLGRPRILFLRIFGSTEFFELRFSQVLILQHLFFCSDGLGLEPSGFLSYPNDFCSIFRSACVATYAPEDVHGNGEAVPYTMYLGRQDKSRVQRDDSSGYDGILLHRVCWAHDSRSVVSRSTARLDSSFVTSFC